MSLNLATCEGGQYDDYRVLARWTMDENVENLSMGINDGKYLYPHKILNLFEGYFFIFRIELYLL